MTNGRVPMENVQISVKLDESLVAARQGKLFVMLAVEVRRRNAI